MKIKHKDLVLITGITGLLGSAVAKKFLSEGYKVRGLVRENADLSLISDIVDRIEIAKGDILDILSIEKALDNVKMVVHAAALVSFARKDAENLLKINVEGTSNMVNCALNTKVEKFCYVSSIAALGRPANIWQNIDKEIVINEKQKWEESDLNSNYAKSKYLAEQEVWRASAEGLNVVILNPTIILGEGNWNNGSMQIFKYVFDRKRFYTLGNINYVDAKDVSNVAYLLCNSEIKNERFAINAGTISVKNLFDKIADNFGIKPPDIKVGGFLTEIIWRFELVISKITGKAPIITKETAKTGVLKIVYNNTKITNALNFKFSDLDDSLNRICKYLLKNNS